MIDTSASNLAQEILAGEELRDKRLRAARDIARQYFTSTYEGSSALDDPENHAFEYVTLMVPQMIFENPAVVISNPSSEPDISELERVTNYWIRKSRIREIGIQLAIDQCISWGVARIDQRPLPQGIPGMVNRNGSLDMPMMPAVSRVPQHRFSMDPVCLDERLARWKAVMIIRDKKSLIEEAKRFPNRGWNLKAIEKLADGVDLRRARPNREDHRMVERHEVVFYEVWVPEEELSESLGPQHGFHGTIRTIACGTSNDQHTEIRKPRPYYGPPSGPFVIFGTHHVPDEPWPLSALYPVQTQVKDLNNHSRAIREAASKHKKLALGDAFSAADAKAINNAHNGDFLLVAGLDKQKVVELGLGGVDEAQLVYRNMARDLLDKNSSLSDALRGAVTGDATAYENMVAAGSSDVRMSFVKRQYQAAMREVITAADWYLYHDDRTAIDLGSIGVYLGGSVSENAKRIRAMFPGVEIPDDYFMDNRTAFEALDIQLEPTSMERPDQASAQRNAMQFFNLITQTIPLVAQFPDATDWYAHFDRLGKAFNEPGLAARVFPDRAAENLAQNEMRQVEAAAKSKQMPAGGAAPRGSGGIGRPPSPPQGDSGVSPNRMQRRIDSAGSSPKVRMGTGSARASSVGGK